MAASFFRNLSLCLFCLVLAVPGAFAASSPEEIREEVLPELGKGLEEFSSKEHPDERTLMEKVTFRDAKFQRIIQDCFEIMADSPLLDLLALQDETRTEIRKAQERLGELARESITAPESSWNPLTVTQESIRKDTQKLRRNIAELQAELERQKDSVYNAMTANGAPLTREQFERMISAADAVENAGIMAVAENLKYVLKSIELKASEPDAPVDLLKMYSGMYMMCYRVYIYAISHAVRQIDEAYLPRLNAMKEENSALLAESRKLAAQSNTENDRKTLQVNMASQQRMLEVIRLYVNYLNAQKKNLASLNADMTRRCQVAENTYHTIRLGAELLGLLHNSRTDFSRIFSFQPPELLRLHDRRFSREFAEVTALLLQEKQ